MASCAEPLPTARGRCDRIREWRPAIDAISFDVHQADRLNRDRSTNTARPTLGDGVIDLEDFIAAALTSIVRGIRNAQADSDLGRFVAPLLQGNKRNDFGNFHLKNDETRQATVVQFDVQVGTETTTVADGKGGVRARLVVVDVELGGGRSSSAGATSLHRLQFNVPVEIPSTDSP